MLLPAHAQQRHLTQLHICMRCIITRDTHLHMRVRITDKRCAGGQARAAELLQTYAVNITA